jgi:excisionase family DNA binding protein
MRLDTSASIGEFKTASELAISWNVTPATIRNLINRRELPGYRIGSKYLVRRADAEAYLQRVATQPQTAFGSLKA